MSRPPAESLPRISVLTPSYNHGRFLETTIRSVLEQDYPAFEYMVLDGGSSDKSPQIIHRYAGRLAYWTNAPDGGQAAALNAGIQRATGDIIGWINSDDFYLPGTLRAIARFFADNPETVLVYGDCYVVDQDGSVLYRIRPGTFNLARLARRCFVMQMSTFFRRELIERVGYFDRRLKYAMDYDLWLRIGLAYPGRISYLPQVLSCYRAHAQSQSTRDELPALLDEVAVRRKFLTQTNQPSSTSYIAREIFREPLRRLLVLAQDPAVSPMVIERLRSYVGSGGLTDEEWQSLSTALSASRLDPVLERKGWEIALRLDKRWTYALAGAEVGDQTEWLASLLMLLGYGHVRRMNFRRALRLFAQSVTLQPRNLVRLDHWTLAEACVRAVVNDKALQALRHLKRSAKALYYGSQSASRNCNSNRAL